MPEPSHSARHYAAVLHPTPARVRRAMAEVDGLNAKLAVLVTRLVGSMWCAYAFTLLALAGLPTALSPGGSGIVSWVAQTFLQLVLLSVIMVGQAVASAASDARASKQFSDTEQILAQVSLVGRSLAEIHEKLDGATPPPQEPEVSPASRGVTCP